MIKELIPGEIYYEIVENDEFISEYQIHGTDYYIQIDRNKFHRKGATINIKDVKRIATSEEKYWLEQCIKADKFIPLKDIDYNKIHELW